MPARQRLLFSSAESAAPGMTITLIKIRLMKKGHKMIACSRGVTLRL